jgi:NAD(P)H-nitrite reductase large subunit
MRRYVIVGLGAAGVAAAEAIRSQDISGEILMIGDESNGFYSRPGLAYYLTGEIPEHQLFPLSRQDFEFLNIHQMHARVVRICADTHQIELHNDSRLSYDRLLIATGASAARLQAPGVELEGVVKLDNLDDAHRIMKQARKSRVAVVIGGGITALEIVEALIAKGVQTHYFLRGGRYWSNVLDEHESRIIEHLLKERGVVIHYNTEMEEVLGKRGRVTGVRTKDGSQVKCDMVGMAIGIRPRTGLAQEAGIKVDRGILVDEYLHTNIPDIFAAGDVAQVFDPYSGKSVLDSLWGPAREQGNAAGMNMAGGSTPYYKTISFNVTRLAHLTTTIIGTVGRGQDEDLLGIARGDSETWRQLPDAIAAQADFEVSHLRILIGAKALVGAIVMGDQTLSNPLRHMIVKHTDITSVKDKWLQPNAPLADLVADFWIDYKRNHASQQS